MDHLVATVKPHDNKHGHNKLSDLFHAYYHALSLLSCFIMLIIMQIIMLYFNGAYRYN